MPNSAVTATAAASAPATSVGQSHPETGTDRVHSGACDALLRVPATDATTRTAGAQ